MSQSTNKLLKQAIADAEAVRETAVASAKLVLEEAFAPTIRDMISRRLQAEAEHEDATEKPFQDAEPVGSSEMPADSSEIGGAENKEPSADAADSSDVGTGPESQKDSSTGWYDDWSESDFDLDEIIQELEEDIAALSESDHEDEKEDEKGEDKEEKGEDSEKKEEPMKEEKEEEKEAPEAEKHDGEEEVDDDEEVSLEEFLAELEADEREMNGTSVHDEKAKMAAKLADLKKELLQYKEAVNTLSGRLQEVNLLNAKLLFTNKIFRKEGLTNEQKVRIVESFDRATTVREVKIVYTTLVENLGAAAKTFKASHKKVVAEGVASKPMGSTAPKSQEPIVENAVAKRLQELAGIL